MSAANALNAFMTTRQFRQGEEDRAMALEDRQRAIGLENTRGKINALMMQPGDGTNRPAGMDAGFAQGQSAPQPSRMDQARQMAVQSGSSELMGQFQQQVAQMSAADRDAAAARLEMFGRRVGDIARLPYQQRRQVMMTPEFMRDAQELGFGPEQVSQFDPTEDALSGLLAQHGMLREVMGSQDVPASVQALQIRAHEGGLQPGSPEYQDFMRNGGRQPRGPLVNVSTGSQQLDPFQSQLAEAEGEVFANFFEAGTQAQRNLAQINRLDQLMQNTETGGIAAVQMMLGNLGINSEGLSDIQAFESLVSAMAPNQRPPGSGPMSDADLQLFLRSLPRLINQPDGNRTIIETLRGIAEYDIQLGNIASRAASGEITREQARQEVNSLSNPLARFGSQRMRYDPASGRLVPVE